MASWTEARKQEHALAKRARYLANREARRSGAAASSAENPALAAVAVAALADAEMAEEEAENTALAAVAVAALADAEKAKEEAEEEEEDPDYDPFAPCEKEEEPKEEEEEEGGGGLRLALCVPYFAEPGVKEEKEEEALAMQARSGIAAGLRDRGLIPPHDRWDECLSPPHDLWKEGEEADWT